MIKALKAALVRSVPDRYNLPLRFAYHRMVGALEPEIALLGSLVKPDSDVVDAGANIGTYVYALHRLARHVHAFEPIPACVRTIRSYRASNVTVHEVALSDAEGRAELAIPIFHGVSTLSRAHLSGDTANGAPPAGTATIAVTLQRLDTFNLRNISFIKIDVEGHEFKVLQGARDTILRNRPNLLIEIEQRHLVGTKIHDIFDWVGALGYQGSFLSGGALHPISEFDLERQQLRLVERLEAHGRAEGYINNFIFKPTVNAASAT